MYPSKCIFTDGPDRIIITPEPVLNVNGNLTVREGDAIGPFFCTADCNPQCNITWKEKDPDGFSDALSEMRTLMQQVVQRNMQLFRCIANWKDKMFQQSIQLDVQCKYFFINIFKQICAYYSPTPYTLLVFFRIHIWFLMDL